jgi:hypothetical protein
MKVTEIITNPPRDEYIDDYTCGLRLVPTIATINGLELKQGGSSKEIEYGLFDKKKLVGFMSLEQYKEYYVVTLVQLAQAFKGMGYGTFLYDFAVMNDKLMLLSDATNTSGKHGSRELWNRLRANNRYKVIGYDMKHDMELPNATEADIYDNDPNTRWLALPPQTTINESITMIQDTMKKRFVVWYGPGTTTPDYFNY